MRDEETPRPGTVYLVGWGPGDSDQATVRALALVRGARRLFLHPGLPAAARQEIPSGATVQDLASPAQLVAAARDDGVIALYAGDPIADGPGAQHAAAVEAAGLAVEIVPGVSRCLWACTAAGVLPGPPVRLELLGGAPTSERHVLVPAGGTAAGRHLAELPAGTPALRVTAPGTPDQELQLGTVATLSGHSVAAGGCGHGWLVVAGPAAARPLPWLQRRPLHGRGIVLTRPREQAGSLARLLLRAGARVLEFPTIATVALDDAAPLDRAIASLHRQQWVIFTSANGVAFFFARLRALGKDSRAFGAARLAAIGPATAAALAGHGLRADLVPERYQAEGLLDALDPERIRGARILIPRAEVARDVLPDTLRASGAQVEVVPTYRTVRPPADAEALRRAVDAGHVHAVTFTSSSTVRNFCASFAEGEAAELLGAGEVAVACIGPITAATAREQGLEVSITAEEFTVEGLTAALTGHFAGAG